MLYIAARDIGNYKDNTERLKEILIKSDIILAESFREATTLFKILNINIERESNLANIRINQKKYTK